MLKVNSGALSVKDGKFYFEEKLFTGVGIEISACTVNRAVKYEDGDVDGAYINEYLPVIKHGSAVVFDCLEPEDEMEEEPLCYKEVRFSGLAYDFDGDFCVGEFLFENGWQDSGITYYRSGVLDSMELVGDDFSQKYYWYEQGQIKRFDLFERNSFEVNLNFNEDGLISTLSINGKYFDRVRELREELKFCLYDNKGFPKELTGADYLYLSGSSVDGEVFDNLLENDGLNNTTKLRICRTPLTIESLEQVIPITSITELYIESEIIPLKDMQRLKSQKPDCFVEFNREEVEVAA